MNPDLIQVFVAVKGPLAIAIAIGVITAKKCMEKTKDVLQIVAWSLAASITAYVIIIGCLTCLQTNV